MAVRLAEILRYPIKGFSAETLSTTLLSPGAGIPFDRHLAVANGQHAIEPEGAWTHCRSFIRLTRNPELPRFRMSFAGEGELSIAHTDGNPVSMKIGDPCSIETTNAAIAGWFPAGPLGRPQLVSVADGMGYWDHRDAAISIINLATTRSLTKHSGKQVDPLRFRGNLHIDGGKAWSELEWLGKRLRIGDAILDVIRPIDRCTAPNVNPETGECDLNIPAMLLRQAGHFFCGVYARVVSSGVISRGAEIEIVGTANDVLLEASKQPTAPAVANWPRPASITTIQHESATVRSFWLKDIAADAGIAPAFRPGQHVRLHALGDNSDLWRSYTVSGWRPDGSLRISVKRAPVGLASQWLHDTLSKGGRLLLSGPFGSFVRPVDASRHVTMFSAGIGITPLLAIAQDIATHAPETRLRFVHQCRSTSELALWDDVKRMQGELPHLELVLHLDQQHVPDAKPHAGIQGSIDWQQETLVASNIKPIIYLCGPRGFMDAARASLRAGGIVESDIMEEVFASPDGHAANRREAPSSGPFQVTFLKSGVTLEWTKDKGTILDCSESQGLVLPAHCRGGACGTCRQPVLSGSIFNITEPLALSVDGTELLCCSVPVSDIVVDA